MLISLMQLFLNIIILNIFFTSCAYSAAILSFHGMDTNSTYDLRKK